MDALLSEWAAQAANDVRELLSRAPSAEMDRLDLLIACGRWAVALEPEGGELEREILLAARGALGRPIDAADSLPDFRGVAKALLDSNTADGRPSFSMEEARAYVEERMDAGFALAALEILWPHEAEELHSYVRKRRGLGPHDRALGTLQPWQEHVEALSLPIALTQFSGLRPLLFGPIADAVEPWSSLRRGLSERRVSGATWHDAACRILEPRVNGAGREAAVDAALARMLYIAALEPDLARTMFQGRWNGLLLQPAADTCRVPVPFSDLAATDVVQGGRILAESLPDLEPFTLGARALSVAAYAQLVVGVAAEVLLRRFLARLPGLSPASVAYALRSSSLGTRLGESHEVLRENGLEVIVATVRREQVVVTVEQNGRPVSGATVTLEHVFPSGERIERARGETNEHGRTLLGPLANFPIPQGEERYQVTVTRAPGRDA